MRLLVYSVFDSKAGVYSHPFYAVSDGVAKRMFIDAVTGDHGPASAGDGIFCKHPEDYSLCAIGGFDDVEGKIGSLAGMPTVMMTGLQAKAIGTGAIRLVDNDNDKEAVS